MKKIKILILLILIVLTFQNCLTNTPEININYSPSIMEDTTKKENKETLKLSNSNIIGDWTNCSSTSNGVTITANVCLEIQFKIDGTAIITYPSKEKEIINWKISNDQIEFSRSNEKSDSTYRMFDENIYETDLTIKSQAYNLELKAKNKDITYNLIRSLN